MEGSPVTRQYPPAHPIANWWETHGPLFGHLCPLGWVFPPLWRSGQKMIGLFCSLLILLPIYQGKLGDMVRYCLSASPAWILLVFHTARWPWAIGVLGILSGLYAFHLLILWLQQGWVG